MKGKKFVKTAVSLMMAVVMTISTPAFAAAAADGDVTEAVTETTVSTDSVEGTTVEETVAEETVTEKTAVKEDTAEESVTKEDAEEQSTEEKKTVETEKEKKKAVETLAAGGDELKKAPEIAAVNYVSDFLSDYYRVSFKGNAEAYLKAAEKGSISLNGSQANRVSSFFGDRNSYKFSSDPAYGGDNIFIDFTGDCFKTGEVNVLIKAPGYEELAFTMKEGKFVPEAAKPEVPEQKKKAPGVKKLELVKSMIDSSYRLSFEGTEQVIGTYLKAIEKGSISFNGETLKKVSSFFGDKKSYKFANDPAYGGDYIYIEFTEDCFKEGKGRVEIKAAGYDDLVFFVENGAIAEEKEEVKFAELAKIIDLGWSSYLVVDLADGSKAEDLTFTVDGNKITPTKVTDDGKIVKWEITSLDHKELVITKGKKEQKIDLGGSGKNTKVSDG